MSNNNNNGFCGNDVAKIYIYLFLENNQYTDLKENILKIYPPDIYNTLHIFNQSNIHKLVDIIYQYISENNIKKINIYLIAYIFNYNENILQDNNDLERKFSIEHLINFLIRKKNIEIVEHKKIYININNNNKNNKNNNNNNNNENLNEKNKRVQNYNRYTDYKSALQFWNVY